MNNNIKIKVEGYKISNYLKWLIKEKINIYSLNIIDKNNLELLINYNDLNKLKKYSPTYKITIIKRYGKLRIKEILKNNFAIFISIILSITLLYFLSNIIFKIEINYNDNDINYKIYKELEKYDIKKYRLKKDKDYLDKVEKLILENNKDILEWIEIIENGTTYKINLVERKKNSINEDIKYQSIGASKKATITNIIAYNGEKIKEIGEYITEDEIAINGIITKPDGSIIYKKAKGLVYGEVWYKVDIEYPLYYQEEKVTGKSKKVLFLNFFKNKISIFPYKKYKQFKSFNLNVLEDNYIPISLSIEKIYEVKVKEEIYTEEMAIEKAIELAKNKMKESNSKIIEINKVEILKKENLNSKIKLKLFISVNEDITKIIEISEENSN